MNDEYLVHYGVLGMKWGVRRGHKYTSLSTHAHRELKEHHEKRAKSLSEAAKATTDKTKKAKLEQKVRSIAKRQPFKK